MFTMKKRKKGKDDSIVFAEFKQKIMTNMGGVIFI